MCNKSCWQGSILKKSDLGFFIYWITKLQRAKFCQLSSIFKKSADLSFNLSKIYCYFVNLNQPLRITFISYFLQYLEVDFFIYKYVSKLKCAILTRKTSMSKIFLKNICVISDLFQYYTGFCFRTNFSKIIHPIVHSALLTANIKRRCWQADVQKADYKILYIH